MLGTFQYCGAGTAGQFWPMQYVLRTVQHASPCVHLAVAWSRQICSDLFSRVSYYYSTAKGNVDEMLALER